MLQNILCTQEAFLFSAYFYALL